MSANYSLLCYTREATGREEANNEDIAYSMHLALRSGDDAEWRPLNENYGIFFAAGVPIAAATAESRHACTAAARRPVRRASPRHRRRRPWRGHARYGYHAEIAEESVPVPPRGRTIRHRRDPYRPRR